MSSIHQSEALQTPNLPAADELWKAFASDLRSYLRRRVKDDSTADDLLQEVFVRAMQRGDQLKDVTRLGGWMMQITRNLLMDHFRREKRAALKHEKVESLETTQVEGSSEPDPTFIDPLAKWFEYQIDLLPEHEREALRRVDIEGASQAEVARELGISHSGLKSRVQRGRAKLRKQVDDCCELEVSRSGKVLECTPRSVDSPCCE